jgi:hypothetical protein
MARVQSNDPRDQYRAGFNESQYRQQARLSGGSWSQPPWSGWLVGAARLGYPGFRPITGSRFLARYAQDGDSGFFEKRGLFGRGDPLGASPFGLNHLETAAEDEAASAGESDQYEEPVVSTAVPEIVEPSPAPLKENLELDTLFNPEPQQRAVHVPPYSRTLVQGLGRAVSDRGSALYEEPFEIPEYKGGFHRRSTSAIRR